MLIIEGIKRKIPKPSTFTLNDLTSTHAAGNNAYRILYTVIGLNLNNTKTLEFLISKGSTIYVISYSTELPRYESDLSAFKNLVESVEII